MDILTQVTAIHLSLTRSSVPQQVPNRKEYTEAILELLCEHSNLEPSLDSMQISIILNIPLRSVSQILRDLTTRKQNLRVERLGHRTCKGVGGKGWTIWRFL